MPSITMTTCVRWVAMWMFNHQDCPEIQTYSTCTCTYKRYMGSYWVWDHSTCTYKRYMGSYWVCAHSTCTYKRYTGSYWVWDHCASRWISLQMGEGPRFGMRFTTLRKSHLVHIEAGGFGSSTGISSVQQNLVNSNGISINPFVAIGDCSWHIII